MAPGVTPGEIAMAVRFRGRDRSRLPDRGVGEAAQFVDGRFAVADDAGRCRQHRAHPLAVPVCLSRPAEFRMSDRNEIVDEIDRPDV